MLLLELLKSKANIKISQKSSDWHGESWCQVTSRTLDFSLCFSSRLPVQSLNRELQKAHQWKPRWLLSTESIWVLRIFEKCSNVCQSSFRGGYKSRLTTSQLCRWILWCFIYLSIYLFKLENFNAFFPTCPTDANSPLWHTEELKCLTAAQERQREIMW